MNYNLCNTNRNENKYTNRIIGPKKLYFSCKTEEIVPLNSKNIKISFIFIMRTEHDLEEEHSFCKPNFILEITSKLEKQLGFK